MFFFIRSIFFKILFVILILHTTTATIFAAEKNELETLQQALDQKIKNRQFYVENKIKKITDLKNKYYHSLRSRNFDKKIIYCYGLFNEYNIYNFDSAYYYLQEYKRLIRGSKNNQIILKANIDELKILTSAGLFSEATQLQKSINIISLDSTNKVYLYSESARLFYDLAQNASDSYYEKDHNYEKDYTKKAIIYQDSLLNWIKPVNFDYRYVKFRLMLNSGDIKNALDYIKPVSDTTRNSALLTTVAYGYSLLGDKNEQKKLLIKASIINLETTRTLNVSYRNLSLLFSEEGDFKRAYEYIRLALDDANTYNSKYRKSRIIDILSKVDNESIKSEVKKGVIIKVSFIITGLISLLLVYILLKLFMQNKKMKSKQDAIEEMNLKLLDLNSKLQESLQISEGFIGNFFFLSNEYISKLESYQRKVYKKAKDSVTLSEFMRYIKTFDFQDEHKFLFDEFDRVFLQLFPNYIEEFNELLKDEERINIKVNGSLNKELRIFALYRLGVDDAVTIAKLLECSVNTVYSYKVKMKGKSKYPKEDFDKLILKIGKLKIGN